MALRPYLSWKIGARIAVRYPISPTKKLVLREILGRRIRSIGTIVVIALVLSLGLSFALSMGRFYESIRQRFDENELWDIRVRFTSMHNSSILDELGRIPGIKSVEPYSSSSAKISFREETAYILHILMKDTGMHLFSSLKEASSEME